MLEEFDKRLKESIGLLSKIDEVNGIKIDFDPATMLIYNTGKMNIFGGNLQLFLDKETMEPLSSRLLKAKQ